jgi:hypothetical protein
MITRIALTVLLASSLALTLGGCASLSDFTIDPTEWFSGDWFGNKKKLPGDRRAVFPEGVPGVTKGIPPELMKGHQEPVEADLAAAEQARQAAVREEKPKPKGKPKPKVAAKQAPREEEPSPTQVTVRRPPASSSQQPASQQSGASPWPDPPAPRGTQTGGGVQWPDPPPTR